VSIAERLESVARRVERSARESGRAPEEVVTIAVSKRQPLERVLEAYELGVRDFGENQAQSFKERVEAFEARGLRDVRWHFIGHLQTNKAKIVAPLAHRIHSVDRWSLVESISRRLPPEGVDVLVQVNLAQEAQKSGVAESEALELIEKLGAEAGIRFRGLMTLPPAGEDAGAYFDRLRGLADAVAKHVSGDDPVEVSMGMSGDFEQAVRCGATHLRIGTEIFGARL
jgi:pyridoxal phosphate enzyme (YggS family)